jgi:hypothetical protein
MDDGFTLKDVVIGLIAAVTGLLSMLWAKQDNEIKAIGKRLGEHEESDDGKFGECGNHRSAEIGALYRHIDSKTGDLGKKIDANHKELNDDIKKILTLMKTGNGA